MDSAADKYACKIKKPRATKEEVAVKRAAELAELKSLNFKLLSEGKLKSTVARIEKLEIQVKVSGSNTFNATKSKFQMKM